MLATRVHVNFTYTPKFKSYRIPSKELQTLEVPPIYLYSKYQIKQD